MKGNKEQDWTRVLQERLQDAALPMETDFAALDGRRTESSRRAAGNYFSDKFAEKPISAPLSAAGGQPADHRIAWWPWTLAGVAVAALAAVLLLRPAGSSVTPAVPHPVPDAGALVAQNTAPVPSESAHTEDVAPFGNDVGSSVGGRRVAPGEHFRSEARTNSSAPQGEARRRPQEMEAEPSVAGVPAGEEIPDQVGNDSKIGNDGRVAADGQVTPLGELAQDGLPEEADRSGRAASRPRLALHLQASSGGASGSGDWGSKPATFAWSDARTDYSQSNDVNPAVLHEIAPTPALPISFGLSGELALSERWSLLAGLEYTQRAGYRMNGTAPQALTLNYLGIPLETRFHFLPEERFRLYLGAGLKAEKCLWTKGGEPLRDPVLFSWNLQAGADFRLVPGVRIYLAPVLSQYLNRSAYANYWDVKPQFSLRAGLSFDL